MNGISVIWGGEYLSTKTYYKNQAVSHNGSSYRANKTTTEEPSDEALDWDILAQGTNASSIDLSDYYTQEEVDNLINNNPVNLIDLQDVSVVSPTNGQILVYDDIVTGKWINQTLSTSGGSTDLTNYYTSIQTDNLLANKANKSTTYTKIETDALLSARDALTELIDVTLTSPSNGQALTYNSTTGKWINQTISAGGSGEVNTASNVGVGGVGLFKQKTGVNLEFKNINAASNKISIVNDTTNSEVDIDVTEANLTLNNLGGTLSIVKGGTGSTSASAALTALGAASSTSLTTHTTNTSNPHSVTAAQTGAIPITDKGIANGVATLDTGAKIPDSQIPDSITRDTELSAGLSTKADSSSLTSHTSNTSNPHSTTAAQVGAIATTARAAANGVASLDASTLIPIAQIPTTIARNSDLTTHTSNTSNPHSVTAAQVGALATSTRGAQNGVASLDGGTLIPVAQIPSTIARSADVTAATVGNNTAQWNASQFRGIPIDTTAPTNNQVLTYVSASGAYIPKSPSTAGVIQIKSVEDAGQVAYTGAALGTSTIYTASITPSSSTSKVLVRIFANGLVATMGASNIYINIKRGTTIIHEIKVPTNSNITAEILDSPATTSAVTYTLNMGSVNASITCYINNTSNGQQTHSGLTLMELVLLFQ
ncbi:hypothetical protein [Nostoc sp.]|uniref:hypothetical protein n=1 Tax=Nostoc sp. TaxID=1180 RepID=UPI002FF7AF97